MNSGSFRTPDQSSVPDFLLFMLILFTTAVSHVTEIIVTFSRIFVNVAPINGNN